MSTVTFEAFPKIPRLVRTVIVTEKIDGTNAQVIVSEDGEVSAASRNRLITPDSDNFGFARWVAENAEELKKLGPGRHFGEWWGCGIQRGYGLSEKRFSLFNTHRWAGGPDGQHDTRPACCHVVPVLAKFEFNSALIDAYINELVSFGSKAAPGFMNPEGIIVFHTASQQMYKRLIENDDKPKSLVA